MKCMFCDNAATVHLTDIVNKKKREAHLCEKCARERDLLPQQPQQAINLKALVNMLAGPLQTPAMPVAPVEIRCPECGLTYGVFKAQGRFGCAHDYQAFASILEPLLERVHRGTQHAGKLPAAARVAFRAARLSELHTEMKVAVEGEDYEQAARLRDLIRQIEAEK